MRSLTATMTGCALCFLLRVGALVAAAQAAVGQHFVVSDWLNVRLQLRDVVYMDRYVFMGEERDALRNYLMLELGLGLFVPPSS